MPDSQTDPAAPPSFSLRKRRWRTSRVMHFPDHLTQKSRGRGRRERQYKTAIPYSYVLHHRKLTPLSHYNLQALLSLLFLGAIKIVISGRYILQEERKKEEEEEGGNGRGGGDSLSSLCGRQWKEALAAKEGGKRGGRENPLDAVSAPEQSLVKNKKEEEEEENSN